MIERKGRPRRYFLDPLPGFAHSGLARLAAGLVELSERVLDQLEDLPIEAMDEVQPETGLSIGRLALHLGWAEMNWLERLGEKTAPDYLSAALRPGALENLGQASSRSCPYGRIRQLYEGLRKDLALPVLEPITDIYAERESRGMRIDTAGVMAHLAWHWTYHSGQIGLLRMFVGYDYTWTFAGGPRINL